METKVMKPSPAMDFNFDSPCTSPYITAPGSPQLNTFFFSPPTTPSRFLSFHHSDFNTSSGSGAGAGDGDSTSSIPFKWEDKPGVPKSNDFSDTDHHFEFNFQRHDHVLNTSLSAEDFFDSGKIKPLKPPPRLQFLENGIIISDSPKSPKSPRSPKSPINVKILKGVLLSPRNKNNNFDPFAAAIEQSRREMIIDNVLVTETHDPIEQQQHSFSTNRNRKWKLRNLFTFKNVSDERGNEEGSLKKYGLLSENSSDSDGKNLRFESTEELKRKTLLTYKRRGILGCLGFNQNVNVKISRAIGSISRDT